MGKNKVSSNRGSGGKRDKFSSLAGKWKFIIIVGIICASTVVGFGIYLGYQYLSTHGIGPGTPTLSTSTFKLISAVDGEDVSDFVEGSIWVPKDTATFEDPEDIRTMSNFEETKSSMDTDDISIDLRNVEYAWFEVDPDSETVFANNWHLLYGGKNYNYAFYAYDPTTDVNFNLLDEDTLAVVDLTSAQAMSGGYLVTMDCPHNTQTAAQLHVGTNWDMEQSEFDELSASEQADYYKEEKWACQAWYYNPNVDTNKDYHSDLEKVTDAFCLMFDFNGSISTTDGDANQVNVTIASGFDVECVISGDKIYFIWFEVFDFEDGAYSIYFDMDTDATQPGRVELTDVDSGRIVVPSDDDNLGAFTKYSDIGA